jgi:hypothetical protein
MKIIATDVVYLGKATPGSGGGGGGAVIDALNVTPSTSAQTITASGGTDGYSPVNVAAVDASIDANIVAGNIKKDVSILGVTGTYEGATPTGTISITSNGTHDVTNYATADVNVPTTAPVSYRAFRVNNGKLANSITTPWIPIPAGTTDIDSNLLNMAYSSTPSSVLSGAIDLSMLTQVTGNSAFFQCFMNCGGITSVDASNITQLSGSGVFSAAFQNSGITSLDFGSLWYINNSGLQGACRNCKYLASINLDSFLGGYQQPIQNMVACDGGAVFNTVLQSVSLPSLKYVNGATFMSYCFKNCIALQTLYFYALTPSSFGGYTNQFTNMLQGVTGCTVHFPSNIQSTIGSWSDVTNGFGGTNTTVLFDLPSTAHLTGADTVEYERNPKYDTATALAWRVKDSGASPHNFNPVWTPYYTSGTTDPAVSDAIYSDAACTQSVTTITAIA